MRAALRSNEAGQAVFRIIAGFGPAGCQAATLIVKYDFDLTRAALELGLARGCEACATGGRAESRRACRACWSTLRQRVHRLLDRVHEQLGDAAPVATHRRPKIFYGADRLRAEGGATLYDRVSESLEVAGPED